MTADTKRVDEDAEERLRLARSLDRAAEIEIYVRSSARRRIVLDGGDGFAREMHGIEDGMAVRRIDSARGMAGFSAISARGPDALRIALRAAQQDSSALAGPRWALADAPPPECDEDPTASGLPEARELEAALRSAVRRLRAAAPRAAGLSASQAWVETALTCDALASSRGARLSRARVRTWMFVRLRWTAGSRCFEAPKLLAVRGTSPGPDAGPLLEHAPARLRAAHEIEDPPRGAVLLAPSSAAALVHALARTLHGEDGRSGDAVGPAYRILDDPSADGGLFGGRFDDAGWSTRPVRLADGKRVVGRLEGRGHLWRASYRDLPEPRSSNLVLEPSPGSPDPGRAPVWFDLRVHGIDRDRWVLEALVAAPDGSGGRVRVEVRPRDLPARCVGTAGRPVSSANGVTTPALLLDF